MIGGFKGNSAGRGLLGKLGGGGGGGLSLGGNAPAPAPAKQAPEETAAAAKKAEAKPVAAGTNADGKKLLGMLKSPTGPAGKKKPPALDKAASVGGGDGAAKKGIARSSPRANSGNSVSVTPGILGGTDLMVLGSVPPSNKKKSPRATMPLQPMVSPLLGPHSSNDFGSPSPLGLSSSGVADSEGPKIVFSIETLLEMKDTVPPPKAPYRSQPSLFLRSDCCRCRHHP
jgi:hypothetical protein